MYRDVAFIGYGSAGAISSTACSTVSTTFPRLAAIGAGRPGLEPGQADARLGVSVHRFGQGLALGGLTDPGLMAEADHVSGAGMAIASAGGVRRVRHMSSLLWPEEMRRE